MDITIDLSWWALFVVLVDIVIRVIAIIVVPRNRKPTSAMAWLLAIYFIPFFGVFLFLLIGNPRLPRKRRRKQQRINDYIRTASANLKFGTLRPDAPVWFDSMVALNTRLGAMPLAGDNGAHLIADYQESLDTMADAIRGAKRYVHVEFYILSADAATENFFSAMEEARARGVTVRVLMDHWANRGKPGYKQTQRRLTAMGAEWHLMLPVQPLRGKYQRPDLRNHRKLLVESIHIVGGGSQNALLCQRTSDRAGLPVLAGPVEATALGSMLVQARTTGHLDGTLESLRDLVRRTHNPVRFDPR